MLAWPPVWRYLSTGPEAVISCVLKSGVNQQPQGMSEASAEKEGDNLANQWGRDSGPQSGGTRGSGALTVILMILCLGLGAAGGYAGFRLYMPDSSPELENARAENARLNAALSAARQELSDANPAEVEDLQAVISRQAADLDAMAEKLAALSSEAPAPEDQTDIVDALSRERDALSAENQTLRADLAALEADRDALRQEAGATEAKLASELARLRDEVIPELTAERDRLQQDTTALSAEQATLTQQLKAALETIESEAQLIATLEARLKETEQNLQAAQAALVAAEAEQPEPAAADTEPAVDDPQSEPTLGPGMLATPVVERRDPDAVAAALRAAPGLGGLSAADRQTLADSLARGECVTTALESVFDRVPILTLRNLIRDLESGC